MESREDWRFQQLSVIFGCWLLVRLPADRLPGWNILGLPRLPHGTAAEFQVFKGQEREAAILLYSQCSTGKEVEDLDSLLLCGWSNEEFGSH